MKKLSIFISIFIYINFIAAFALAAVSVNLELDRSQALLTDAVQLTVSVTGSRDSESRPVIHGLDHFKVSPGGTASRPSTSAWPLSTNSRALMSVRSPSRGGSPSSAETCSTSSSYSSA